MRGAFRLKKVRQICAWVGIVLLVGMYVTTLVASLLKTEYANGLFWASVYCTIVVPVLLYVFFWIYKRKHPEGEVSVRQIIRENKRAEHMAALSSVKTAGKGGKAAKKGETAGAESDDVEKGETVEAESDAVKKG